MSPAPEEVTSFAIARAFSGETSDFVPFGGLLALPSGVVKPRVP